MFSPLPFPISPIQHTQAINTRPDKATAVTDKTLTEVFNANGIRVERSTCTSSVTGGATRTIRSIYIWAGRKRIMAVTEPWANSCGRVTICGDWNVSVRQDLNLLQSATISGLPPYSELANDTTNAGVARRTETTIKTGELTSIRNGFTWVTKHIYIMTGEDTVTLSPPLTPARPGLTPRGLCPGSVPSVAICGQWILNKRYKSWKLPAQPTIATPPNFFRRMSAMIKALGRTDTSKQLKETEKEATAPAVKG